MTSGRAISLVGLDVSLTAGTEPRLPLDPDFAYGVLTMSGELHADGVPLSPGSLLHLGCGRTGEPFGERLITWWNVVGRTMPTAVAPNSTSRAHSRASRPGLAMWLVSSTARTWTPCSRRKPRCRSARSPSVQWVPIRTSTWWATARSRSAVVPQPGSMKTAILLCRRASRTIDSISSSSSLACPTCREEAPRPLPCPTSTTGTPAVSAARAWARSCSRPSWWRTAWWPSRRRVVDEDLLAGSAGRGCRAHDVSVPMPAGLAAALRTAT